MCWRMSVLVGDSVNMWRKALLLKYIGLLIPTPLFVVVVVVNLSLTLVGLLVKWSL